MKFTSLLPERATWAGLLSVITFLVCVPLASAQSSSTIAQSFTADTAKEDIVSGALVSTSSNKDIIELATPSTANRLVGVVDNSPLVSLSRSDQKTDVVISGATKVLVSDINGSIKSGDRITASPLAGIGMKATASSQVVGIAQDSFVRTTSRNMTDRDGEQHKIQIGYVQVQIGIATYQSPGSNFLPPFIQNAANSIAGQPVSLVRVLICSTLLILGFATVITLVYTSARSAMTSLGRNPLAAQAIRRSLYQVGLISLLVVSGTILACYLILAV